MSGLLKFNRLYADYGTGVREFERNAPITRQLTGILVHHGYTIDALLGARFTAQWLSMGDPGTKKLCELDFIFQMKGVARYEVILHEGGTSRYKTYGGWLLAGARQFCTGLETS